MGPIGPIGPTGPTGETTAGTITPRFVTRSVLRPNTNQPLIAEVDCDPGETIVGGGVRATATNPTNDESMHLQESGPTPTGWLGRVSATSRFAQGSSLEVTVTVFCLAP